MVEDAPENVKLDDVLNSQTLVDAVDPKFMVEVPNVNDLVLELLELNIRHVTLNPLVFNPPVERVIDPVPDIAKAS